MASSGFADKQVQKTNDYSSVSKHSMCAAGYCQDRFLQHVVAKRVKRAPIINRGYYVRMKAVDTVVSDFLQNAWEAVCPANESGSSRTERPQLNILVLGAGYDTLFFRLQENHKDLLEQFELHYVEIDFLDVCTNKSLMIQAQPEMLQCLAPPLVTDPAEYDGYTIVLRSCAYALVAFDLRKPALFHSLIKTLPLDCSAPTLVISEVVLTYLDDCYVADIFKTVSGLFHNSLLLNYEQVEPQDSFGRFMMQHFEKQSTPLLNIRHYPTVRSHQERFLDTGWSGTLCLSVSEFYAHFLYEEEKIRIGDLEPFDEYEEFMEKMRHYTIALAANGACIDVIDNYRTDLMDNDSIKASFVDLPADQDVDIEQLPVVPLTANVFNVYGHASAEVKLLKASGESVYVVVLIGGVSKNQEIKEDLNGDNLCPLVDLGPGLCGVWISTTRLDPTLKRPLVHLGAVVHSSSCNTIFVTGGRTSPSAPNTAVYTIEISASETTNEVQYVVRKGGKVSLLNSEQGANRCQILPLVDDEDSGLALAVQSLNPELQCSSLDFLHCELKETGPYVTQVSTNTSYPARFGSSALLGPRRAVLSGGLRDDLAVNNVFLFDASGDDWPYLGEMAYPRFGHTSHVYEDVLILIGGVSHARSPLPDVSVFHLQTKKEKHFSLKFPTAEAGSKAALVLLFNHTSLLITRNEPKRIVVFGGGGNCFSFGTHFNAFPFYIELAALL